MSTANVYRYLDWLEARGYITRQSGVARSIRLLEHNES
jgi:Fe2+ or Zn2+ uptake regulation protein